MPGVLKHAFRVDTHHPCSRAMFTGAGPPHPKTRSVIAGVKIVEREHGPSQRVLKITVVITAVFTTRQHGP